MKWNIGDVEIGSRIVLAPMAGISTPAYMRICEEMGVGYVVTELLSAEAIVRGNEKTFDMLAGIDKLKIPVAVQIFGSNPSSMARAAQMIVDAYHVDMIDINMGCPVPKVAVRANAGSALLKDIDKIEKIVTCVVGAVCVPVTVKIRSGWDDANINAREVARTIAAAGAKAIAIHARTRSQGYSGHSDWDIIRQVKEAVDIPVIGNGDVTTPELAKKMRDETGCDAVMIGRGLLGNPWLIAQSIEYMRFGFVKTHPANKDKIDMIEKHYRYLSEDKKEKVALLEIRSHILWYLKGLPNSALVKNNICSAKSSAEVFAILSDYYETLIESK